jgi:hypothetical protein
VLTNKLNGMNAKNKIFTILTLMVLGNSMFCEFTAQNIKTTLPKGSIKITKMQASPVNAIYNPTNDCISIESANTSLIFSSALYDYEGSLIRKDFALNNRINFKCNNLKKGRYSLLIVDNKGQRIGRFEVMRS